jgi:ABC-type bacteriocin/lantibiotic exporter with double-glycine peptidase domain
VKTRLTSRRRFLVPEVVQTSAMDCGPAALKCLLEGFGIRISYGRLREACQTDVDGTSIDTMEELAGPLGLNAEQVMLPVDHLLLGEAQSLPAIVVVRMPNGFTHFVVAWSAHGPLLQLMDPALGRRWISRQRFLEEVYAHTFPISARYWREWAGSDQFLRPLRRRLENLSLTAGVITRLVDGALADASWRTLAALDATTRMIDSMVRSGGLGAVKRAAAVLESFFEECLKQAAGTEPIIPGAYWFAQPGPPGPDGEEQVLARGAVLIRVLGRKEPALPEMAAEPGTTGGQQLPPELVAALTEAPSHPGRQLLRFLQADGPLIPATLTAALALAAGGVVFEALLFRGLFELGRELHRIGERLGAMAVLIAFTVTLLFLEFPIAASLLRMGRRLELRLRMAFLTKIPQLVDRYFQSRLTSDMAERSHAVHGLRLLPELAGGFVRSSFELLLTTTGIIWLAPASAPMALLAVLVAVGVPLLANPLLTERDLRVRTHVGALSRFYLDALLGLVAVRAHGAERAIRSEHEGLLVEWSRASLDLQRTAVAVEGVQSLAGFGLAAWLLFGHLARTGETAGGVLLLVYWALNLPVLGQEIALVVRQYPALRNVTLRILEPLGAPEMTETAETDRASSELSTEPCAEKWTRTADAKQSSGLESQSIAITFEHVSVRASGHTLLQEIELTIDPGSHVAIVGSSGAGKSSLVGLLLGWHRPASGRILVDGGTLDGARLERLRSQTAWVDPAVHLWNRSFLDNLRYGVSVEASLPIGWAMEQADLLKLLESLPGGMQTPLGEGGALVSGGEGQRIRLARALLRSPARLVILDEPFRGLDRECRRQLLKRARSFWSEATLLCITHDLAETRGFERVLVMEKGQIVEDDAPQQLIGQADSRYASLLQAEEGVRDNLWSNDLWQRQWLEGGRLMAGKQRIVDRAYDPVA